MHADFAHIGDPATNLIEECAELIQALTKLQRFGPGTPPYDNRARVIDEIADVRNRITEWDAALATQPAQGVQAAGEAVSHTIASGEEGITVAFFHSNHAPHGTSLYLAAPTVADRVPLSDEQIEAGRRDTFSTDNPYCPCDSKTMRKAVRWTERKHGIGAEKTGEQG